MLDYGWRSEKRVKNPERRFDVWAYGWHYADTTSFIHELADKKIDVMMRRHRIDPMDAAARSEIFGIFENRVMGALHRTLHGLEITRDGANHALRFVYLGHGELKVKFVKGQEPRLTYSVGHADIPPSREILERVATDYFTYRQRIAASADAPLRARAILARCEGHFKKLGSK
ncbi:MAG: hypothetical protein ABIG96_05715 [Candidatus Micrarchaeota archaeon]